jgi:hypothetical protein
MKCSLKELKAPKKYFQNSLQTDFFIQLCNSIKFKVKMMTSSFIENNIHSYVPAGAKHAFSCLLRGTVFVLDTHSICGNLCTPFFPRR